MHGVYTQKNFTKYKLYLVYWQIYAVYIFFLACLMNVMYNIYIKK